MHRIKYCFVKSKFFKNGFLFMYASEMQVSKQIRTIYVWQNFAFLGFIRGRIIPKMMLMNKVLNESVKIWFWNECNRAVSKAYLESNKCVSRSWTSAQKWTMKNSFLWWNWADKLTLFQNCIFYENVLFAWTWICYGP